MNAALSLVSTSADQVDQVDSADQILIEIAGTTRVSVGFMSIVNTGLPIVAWIYVFGGPLMFEDLYSLAYLVYLTFYELLWGPILLLWLINMFTKHRN